MRKNIFFIAFGLLFYSITTSLIAKGSSNGSSSYQYSVGFTVKNLSNPTWGGTAKTLDNLIKEDGGNFTYVDNQGNPNKQIQQVENFITNGIDVLVIQVAEENSLSNVLQKARNAGIKVFCWDDDIENSDINWIIDNYEAGKIIGTEAAKWINEKFAGETEYAILSYDQEEILLQRGNGIREAIQKLAPNATLVGDQPAINPNGGMSQTETFLQAYPDLKVIAAIGGGGSIGANNAVKAANKLSDDFGIFAADATPEEVKAIRNNEAIRMSLLFSGSPKKNGHIIWGWVKKLINNEDVPRRIVRNMIPITKKNIAIVEE